MSAAVDAHGRLCVWGKLDSSGPSNVPIFNFQTPAVVQTARITRVCTGLNHILALMITGEVLRSAMEFTGGSATATRSRGRTSACPR